MTSIGIETELQRLEKNFADFTAVSKEIIEIKKRTDVLTEDLHQVAAADTSADPQNWSKEGPLRLWGHCAIVACIVQKMSHDDRIKIDIVRGKMQLPKDNSIITDWLASQSPQFDRTAWIARLPENREVSHYRNVITAPDFGLTIPLDLTASQFPPNSVFKPECLPKGYASALDYILAPQHAPTMDRLKLLLRRVTQRSLVGLVESTAKLVAR